MSVDVSGDQRLGVFTRKLKGNPLVKTLFGCAAFVLKPKARHAGTLDSIIGWGRKPQSLKAKNYAKKHGLPYFSLEDGFIHSMSQGRLGESSWSLVKDDLGIYYDAASESVLERLINSRSLTESEDLRASKCIEMITRFSIVKYNNAKRVMPASIKSLDKAVLVVDQVRGDMSIPYSLACDETFNEMLVAALSENPESVILIKVHPDVLAGKRRGCIALPKKIPGNIRIISDNLNSLQLLRYVDKVYTVSSQMGFEALLMEKKVICYGAPFYAGWGLTEDRLDKSLGVFRRRCKKVDLRTVFHSAYIDYSHYFSPETHRPCDLEDIIKHVRLQYSMQDSVTGKIFCIGFSPWKKRFIKYYLKSPDSEVFFVDSAGDARLRGFDSSSKVCLWSSRYESEGEELSQAYGAPIWRIEDGFIRSVSLGSNYIPPASLVIDKSGLYFDPSRPSDLESLLNDSKLNEDQLVKARMIREQLIHQRISKYNVGARGVSGLFSAAADKRKILVPGQVSDDASILKGCREVRDNSELLKIVRAKNPEAYIIYKPHPDVLSGNREGEVSDDVIQACADEVVESVSVPDCLAKVHEVHTMTSLVGFEALMRELKVHCYGIPFYAGWGLTQDLYSCSGRKKKLTLDELVAGTLLLYPMYMNWDTKAFTEASFVANKLYKSLKQGEVSSSCVSSNERIRIGYFSKKYNLFKVLFGRLR